MSEILNWAQTEVLGNRLLDFFYAALTFLGLWAALLFFPRLILTKILQSLSDRKENPGEFLRGAQIVTNSLRRESLFALAIALALLRLNLSAEARNIIHALAVGIVILQLASTCSRLLAHLISTARFGRDPSDPATLSVKLNLTIIARIAIWITALVFLLSNLGVNVTTFVTSLGIGGIAIALAAQNILGDVFSSFIIALDKPFTIGDSIEFDRVSGSVEHIGLKTTRLRAPTGELVIVPNSDLTKARIQNFEQMRRRRAQVTIKIKAQTPTSEVATISTRLEKIVESDLRCDHLRTYLSKIDEGFFAFDVTYYVNSSDYNEFCAVVHQFNLKVVDELGAQLYAGKQ